MDQARHSAQILDQFTRQADPFAQRHAHSNNELLDLMFKCSGVRPEHSILDVACGPGIVSCFFASRVRHVTGLDMVPAMLDRAHRLQAERQLNNVSWQLGSATSLGFPESTFDFALTRFSFHHFLDPSAVLREMKRVCKPGGIIQVTDVTPSALAQGQFNHWEVLRDPSHTRALTRFELEQLGAQEQLQLSSVAEFQLEMDLEQLLSGSFPKPGDADQIRLLFSQEIQNGTNSLGVAAHASEGRRIKISYPVSICTWRVPSNLPKTARLLT